MQYILDGVRKKGTGSASILTCLGMSFDQNEPGKKPRQKKPRRSGVFISQTNILPITQGR
jgi:hypothetical protein